MDTTDLTERLERTYRFFCILEQEGKAVTIEEIASATGFTIKTVENYVFKKWNRWFLIPNEGLYFCKGLCNCSKEEFIREHDLKWRVPRNEEINLKYSALLELKDMVNENREEAAFQKHLDTHFWMFGSEYNEHTNQRRWTRDEQQDFMLQRTVDNYLEMIEIKTPLNGQPLFLKDNSHQTFYIRSEVAVVLGQVMNYIDKLDAERYTIKVNDNKDVGQIKAKIIIGRDINDTQISLLRRFNSHLNRIEILTFDQLIRIAEQTIKHL